MVMLSTRTIEATRTGAATATSSYTVTPTYLQMVSQGVAQHPLARAWHRVVRDSRRVLGVVTGTPPQHAGESLA